MPNVKISELPTTTTATDAEVPAVVAGVTRKVTPKQLASASVEFPAADPATSRTLDADDDQTAIRLSAATTVIVTVPSLAQGTRVLLVQEGDGQIQLSADGVTLQHPSTYVPNTAERYCAIELVWLTATLVQVLGELEVA